MPKLLSILLVEDDIFEVLRFNNTVSKLAINCNIKEAYNGAEALKILENSAQLPHLILLDINMPVLNGKELLKILKSSVSLKHIPTVMFTTSEKMNDLEECYNLGINGYMLKPSNYDEYVSKINSTLRFWSEIEYLRA
jgi:CheY-like chemotaxis protein